MNSCITTTSLDVRVPTIFYFKKNLFSMSPYFYCYCQIHIFGVLTRIVLLTAFKLISMYVDMLMKILVFHIPILVLWLLNSYIWCSVSPADGERHVHSFLYKHNFINTGASVMEWHFRTDFLAVRQEEQCSE